jgi:hypothetical protein
VNFVTHLESRDRALFRAPDEQLLQRYRNDFRDVFGFELDPFWTHVARVPLYSPIFYRSYRNPPIRSQIWRNLYFAGNYRTFPSMSRPARHCAQRWKRGPPSWKTLTSPASCPQPPQHFVSAPCHAPELPGAYRMGR